MANGIFHMRLEFEEWARTQDREGFERLYYATADANARAMWRDMVLPWYEGKTSEEINAALDERMRKLKESA